MRKLRLAGLVLILIGCVAGHVKLATAGSYFVASETNPDVVFHPFGFNGLGGVVSVSVCIDPTSAHAAAMEIPVQNAIDAWNDLVPSQGNLLVGAGNDVPANHLDFESVVVHELGHCIGGLNHPNAVDALGSASPDVGFTFAGDGADNSLSFDDGADNVRGSADDLRGDDVNLHWFRTSNNNPFTLAPIVDSTTYSRNTADLPVGQFFASNANRFVSALLGVPNSEAVMYSPIDEDEAKRSLAHDDVAMLRYGMSGLDETAGTGDDYTIALTYAGLTATCDTVIRFDAADAGASVAKCTAGAASFVSLPNHRVLTLTSAMAVPPSVPPRIAISPNFNYYFTPASPLCGNSVIDAGEQCDDGNTTNGDCCSATCRPANAGAACENGLFCDELDTCDVSGVCLGGPPIPIDDGVGCTIDVCNEQLDVVENTPSDALCDNGAFCDGAEVCNLTLDCQSGQAPPVDDGDPCTIDFCDEVNFVQNVFNSAQCDDGNFCNGSEICISFVGCQPGTPLGDDGVDCTDDSCDEILGVSNTPNAANCDDFDPCTAESCDAVTGCAHVPILGCVPPAVVTFDGVVAPAGEDVFFPYEESGFEFSNPAGVFVLGALNPSNTASNGTALLGIESVLPLILVHQSSTFSIFGMEIGQLVSEPGGAVTVTGIYAAGGTIQTTFLTNTDVLTPVSFGAGWEGLISVEFEPLNPFFAMDNVELAATEAPAAVPALSPLLLWGLGSVLASIGLVSLTRKA